MDWTPEFDRWWENIESKSDPLSVRIATTVIAQMKFLTDLESGPKENMATLRTVAQSKRYRLWRVSHPYEKDVAVRLIVWFPPDSEAVVVVALAANKAPIGDIFTTELVTEQMQQYMHDCKKQRRQNEHKI